MYLKYGNYRHADYEASVSIAKEGLFTAGISRGVRERWNIQGRLQAADQDALTVQIRQLTAAYARQGQDVGFYIDDAHPTSHVILSANTLGGVRVVSPPSFPEGKGAEYSTFRSYSIVLEADWIDPQAGLLSWNETLNFQGGGPQFIYLEPMEGPPVKQWLKQSTTYHASQSGQAVGHLGYPLPPAPLWPMAEHMHRRSIRYELPERQGPPGRATYVNFKVYWSYQFEDAGPLLGLPSAWPG